MSKIIADRQKLQSEFLSPIAKIRPELVAIDADGSDLVVTVIDDANDTSLYARHTVESISGIETIGLKSVERLNKALSFASEPTVTLEVGERFATYNGPGLMFETPLLNETLISRIRLGLRPEMFDKFTFDFSFDLPVAMIDKIQKGRQFAAEADSLVFSTTSTNMLRGTLEKNGAGSCDNITFDLMALDRPLRQPYRVGIGLFSALTVFGENVTVLLNEDKKGFIFITQTPTTTLKYGVRTLK